MTVSERSGRLHWSVAVGLAKNVEDLTYEEWCNLYVNSQNPTTEQIARACETTHAVLVRHRIIESSVRFDRSIREART